MFVLWLSPTFSLFQLFQRQAFFFFLALRAEVAEAVFHGFCPPFFILSGSPLSVLPAIREASLHSFYRRSGRMGGGRWEEKGTGEIEPGDTLIRTERQ